MKKVLTAIGLTLGFSSALASPQYDQWVLAASNVASFERKNGESLHVSVQCHSPGNPVHQVVHKLPSKGVDGAEALLDITDVVDKYNSGSLQRAVSIDDGLSFYNSSGPSAEWMDNFGVEYLFTQMWYGNKTIGNNGPKVSRFLNEIEQGSDTLTIKYRESFIRDTPLIYASTFPLEGLENLLFDDMYYSIMECDRS